MIKWLAQMTAGILPAKIAPAPSRRQISLLAVLFLLTLPLQLWSESHLSEQEIIHRVLHRIKENDTIANDYGYHQEALVRDMDSKHEVVKEETRAYRVIWLENEPFNELIKVNGKDLTTDHKKEEAKRRSRFTKAAKEKKPEYKLNWDEIFAKFNYKVLPVEDGAAYVMTFEPKPSGLQERTRGEKILNHVTGKVWIDSNFNILKGTAHLIHEVKFGLGILGNLESLDIEYAQQFFNNKVWLPKSLRIAYSARIIFKSRHQQYESNFYDMYARQDAGEQALGK